MELLFQKELNRILKLSDDNFVTSLLKNSQKALILQQDDGANWNFRKIRVVEIKKVAFEQEAKENQVPIQAVVFRRELFEQYDGFQTKLDAYADWKSWMRYLSKIVSTHTDKTRPFYQVGADIEKSACRRDCKGGARYHSLYKI